jgi:hypothetical protein
LQQPELLSSSSSFAEGQLPLRTEDDNRYPLYKPKPFGYGYILLLAAGAVLAVALYWGLTSAQRIPPIGASFDEKLASARFEALKVALTTAAGVAAIAGLYVGYRKQRNDEANSLREQDPPLLIGWHQLLACCKAWIPLFE